MLSQFLYKYRKLTLPAIGEFVLGRDVLLPDAASSESVPLGSAIEFSDKAPRQPDPALIDFISAQTGKIKPLALADLESYLGLGKELLNIGKPFHIDGIGTITRDDKGKMNFAPGEFAVMTDQTPVTRAVESVKSLAAAADPAVITGPRSRRLALTIALVAALLIAGWGGYLMYSRNNRNGAPQQTIASADTPVAAPDTARRVPVIDTPHQPADSPALIAGPASTDSAVYKWVILATHNKEHALRRYNQLKSFDLKPFLFTEDSLYFKVYFKFRAAVRDTARIRDSIRRQYDHNVYVER